MQFRITPEERELLVTVAAMDKQSAADWCRTTALGVAEVQYDDQDWRKEGGKADG